MPALMAGLRIGATLAMIGVVGDTGPAMRIFGEGQTNTAMVFKAVVLLTLIGILPSRRASYIIFHIPHIPRALR